MSHLSVLRLDDQARSELLKRLIEVIEEYLTEVDASPVAPELNPEKIRALLRPFDLTRSLNPLEALDFVVSGLLRYQVHTPHARYFGLFNPAPTTMGIVADALVAAFNPQLAAWSHSPFAVEIEQHLVRDFASKFGYNPADSDGTFASGGAEANHTALLTALIHSFPEFARTGLRGLSSQPVLYVSSESHHSLTKAARLGGLGTDAVHVIPVDQEFLMDPEALASRIHQDREDGYLPFMVVATAGTTNAGTIDDLSRIADIAAEERVWFHVDAAWGGAVALVPEYRKLLDGIERSDSITFDAHKWLSVPMGAGLYLTRHPDILERTFRITAGYMPREGRGLDVVDPYVHSIQWSRRFIGLKVFLSLVVAGWEGYAAAIRHMLAMGDYLRREMDASSWKIVNKTSLPLACFVDQGHPDGRSAPYLEAVVGEVIASGKAWISTTRIGGSTSVIRACVTNYRTQPEDVHTLIDALDHARGQVRKGAA